MEITYTMVQYKDFKRPLFSYKESIVPYFPFLKLAESLSLCNPY